MLKSENNISKLLRKLSFRSGNVKFADDDKQEIKEKKLWRAKPTYIRGRVRPEFGYRSFAVSSVTVHCSLCYCSTEMNSYRL